MSHPPPWDEISSYSVRGQQLEAAAVTNGHKRFRGSRMLPGIQDDPRDKAESLLISSSLLAPYIQKIHLAFYMQIRYQGKSFVSQ